MITDAENSPLNDPRTRCLVSIFTVRINSLSSGLYVPYKKGTYRHFRQLLMSDIAY